MPVSVPYKLHVLPKTVFVLKVEIEGLVVRAISNVVADMTLPNQVKTAPERTALAARPRID